MILDSALRLTIFGASAGATLPRRVYSWFSKNKRNLNLDCFEAHFDRLLEKKHSEKAWQVFSTGEAEKRLLGLVTFEIQKSELKIFSENLFM